MDDFKSAAAAVCMVSAGICAVRGLVSGTSLRGKVEMILKMVFAIVLLAPVVGGCKDAELPRLGSYELSEYGYSMELYNAELAKQAKDNLTAVLVQQMEANGVECGKIEVDVNISADGGISISRVTVSVDDFDRAAEIIRNCLGSGTEVVDGNN